MDRRMEGFTAQGRKVGLIQDSVLATILLFPAEGKSKRMLTK